MLKKFKWIIVLVIVTVVMLFLWKVSTKLVQLGGSVGDVVAKLESEDILSNKITNSYLVDREYSMSARGIVRQQSGSEKNKAIQCAYDFFYDYFPELRYDRLDFNIVEIGEYDYEISIGDWVLYIRNEFGLSYAYKCTKVVDFTEKEREVLSKEFELSRFTKEGDMYVWEME